MSQKDGWFLGLLALAYLYIDATSRRRPMRDDARIPASSRADDELRDPSRFLPVPVVRSLPVKVTPRDVCPRNHLHPVALRPDGAMWCRGCDEAFYPQVTIWDAITSAAAA
jgi:hypothetical protein